MSPQGVLHRSDNSWALPFVREKIWEHVETSEAD